MPKKLDKIFNNSKIISIDLYLKKVLYDKNYGYYQSKNPFGAKGDFVTAPNISNLFGEMIAIWFVSFWESLNKPKTINFVELGPGNGDLCLILLKTLKSFPSVFDAVNIFLYEKSKKLEKIQKKRIVSDKVNWVKNLNKIQKGPIVFFGNEFLDALPIKQFKKINNDICERYVSLKKNKVEFIYKKALKKNINKLKKYNLLKTLGIIEYPENGFKELKIVCNKIKKMNGGALFIDYGSYGGFGDTLQAITKHSFTDPLNNPGNSDLTTHVNFEAISDTVKSKGLRTTELISQRDFLSALGIRDRSRALSRNCHGS